MNWGCGSSFSSARGFGVEAGTGVWSGMVVPGAGVGFAEVGPGRRGEVGDVEDGGSVVEGDVPVGVGTVEVGAGTRLPVGGGGSPLKLQGLVHPLHSYLVSNLQRAVGFDTNS